MEFLRINEHIRVPEVRVISADGENLGVMPTAQALQTAHEQELDLVEVFPKAQPPVCKIAAYGQLKYQREKHLQKQKAHQKKIEIKSIRLSFRIGEHDMDMRLKQAAEFLADGHKLKAEMTLRGRERQFPERAREIIVNFIAKLKTDERFSLAEEQPLTKQQNSFSIILANKK
jgi:translation initiation factor IF-3